MMSNVISCGLEIGTKFSVISWPVRVVCCSIPDVMEWTESFFHVHDGWARSSSAKRFDMS